MMNAVLNLPAQFSMYNPFRLVNPGMLTVLNYHRIENPHAPGFHTLKINVSATPDEFALQMDYLREYYHVIGCDTLVSFLRGEANLPPRAALITFDDGYYDNYSNAYPILAERELPAIIFLTTGHIGKSKAFYWDYVSYCFFYTQKKSAHLPLIGDCSWDDEASRERVLLRWIESLKRIPEAEKIEFVSRIASILEVAVSASAFENLHLNWDQVRAMSRSGLIEFGAHTVTHPILTRVPIEQAAFEICESKRRIEEETGKAVTALAYPNGGRVDFSQPVMQAARDAGIEVAFSLLPGPTRYSTVRKNALSVRRIFFSYHDTFPRFVAKLSGLARLLILFCLIDCFTHLGAAQSHCIWW